MSTTEADTLPGITLFGDGAAASAYEKGWGVAVQCRIYEVTDIDAIKRVYDVLAPPALITTVATIVGAIYADSYWNSTQMDPQLLANSLQKAKGWAAAECLAAAKEAFKSWYGLLIRTDFNDVGSIPREGRIASSPDVLCNKNAPLDRGEMLQQWNSYFFNVGVGKNYCYARAQNVNLPVPIKKATTRIFFTDAGFSQPPKSWRVMSTFEGGQTSLLEGMAPASINMTNRVTSGAFSFEPPEKKPYCLIAVASTEFFANNPLESTGNWSSYTWTKYNGAVAWYNMTVAPSATSLVFHNQDATAERFSFEAHCHRLPAGTVVSLAPAGPGLQAERREVRVDREFQVVATDEAVVPGDFAGQLAVSIDTPDGAALPAGAMVELRMLWTLPVGHPHHADAVAESGASANAPAHVQLGHYTFVGSES